jgi:hypothetical protein
MAGLEDFIKIINMNNKKAEEVFRWGTVVHMTEEKPKKEPKTRDHFMVTCLMEEILKSPRKFTERENNFIRSLNSEFFNNSEFKLTHKQTDWLEFIWTK